ncbi:hypothetical protein BH20GEM2_BH20GEM2_18450 [soil metagenome]|jgi:uncharacterized protein (DUF433 family)
MPATSRSLRVPEGLGAELEREFRRRGCKDWSSGVLTLLEEALRISRAPGIVFADAPTGRRAVVAGSGIDVWEVIASWRQLEGDYDRLRGSYDWLSEAQLRSALAYYELYPDEIDQRLAREEEWTQERTEAELPFARSPRLD